MGKLRVLFFLLLISFGVSAQKIQKVNTYGYEYNRFIVDTLFALPGDTFTVPAALQSYPFLAKKGTTLYLWNTSTLVWASVSGGGGGSTPTLQQVLTAGNDVTTNQTITTNSTVFRIKLDEDQDGVGFTGLNYNGLIGFQNGNGVMQFQNGSNLVGFDFSQGSARVQSSSSTKLSAITTYFDSVVIYPQNGNLKIDSLNYTLSTTGKKIMLRDTATGLVQNIDPLLLAQEAANFADTTNFKPVVINTTGTSGTIGKIYKATYWPGGGGGGSTSPSGSDTYVQFNDGGSFGGDAGLVYTKTNDSLVVGQVTVTKNDNFGAATGIVQIKRDVLSATDNIRGFYDATRFSAASTPSSANPAIAYFDGNPTILGGDSIDHVAIHQSRWQTAGTAGQYTDRIYGFVAARGSVGTGTTVGNSYGLYVWQPLAAGTLLNNYGIYIEPLTSGSTTNWGIYNAINKSWLGGETFVTGTLQVNNGTQYGASRITMGGQSSDYTQRIAYYEGTGGTSFYGQGMANPSSGNFGVATWVAATPSNTNMATLVNLDQEFLIGSHVNNGDNKLQVTGNSYISGKLGIGNTAAAARLDLPAGTATAGTAPLKLTSGTNLTTPESGAIEFDGKSLFFTPAGIRKEIPTIISSRSTGQTAAVGSVATQTVGASDASFLVSANILITTSSAEAFTTTVAYTDEGNTARTLTLNYSLLAGTIGVTIAAANGAVPYSGVPVQIRCKASTTITIATTGTFTGATYNVEGTIQKIQ